MRLFRTPKTVYVHAGMSKTGTTSLQKMLLNSQQLLAKYGIHYAEQGRGEGGAHHELCGLIKSGKPAELAVAYKTELSRCHADKVIISTELLERCKSKHWQTLKELTSPHPIKIIYYLRKQEDALASMYNELCKKHAVDLPFSDYVRATPRVDLLDYQSTLAGIEDEFGIENMSVGVFSRDCLAQGDIGIDFMQRILSRKRHADSFTAKHINAAILPATAMIMARINRHTKFNVDHSKQYALACLLASKIDIELRKRKTDKHSYFQSAEDQSEFASRFDKSNREVEQRYLGGQPLLRRAKPKPSLPFDLDTERSLLLYLNEVLLEGVHGKSNDVDVLASRIGEYWQNYLFQNHQVEPISKTN